MFRSVPMAHLQVQVPARDAYAVTRHIASEGLLHLVDTAHGRAMGDTAPPGTHELLAAYRDLVRRIRRLATRLESPFPELAGSLETVPNSDVDHERREIETALGPIEHACDEVWRRMTEAAEQQARTRAMLDRARRLREARIDARRIADLRFASVRLCLAPADGFTSLASLLTPAPFAIVSLGDVDDHTLAAVAVPASGIDRLEHGLRLVSLETWPLEAATADVAAVEAELHQAEEDRTHAGQELAELRSRALPTLEDLWRRAEVGALLLQAQTCFVAAGRFIVISGWIPQDRAEAMEQTLTRLTGGRAVVTIYRPDDLPEVRSGALSIPILYRNPLLLRPFERLVELYGTPYYRELEPTAFFAASFLLMFGLMFGDAGHGLVLFSAGSSLFRYMPRFLDYGVLLMECGVSSAIFGILYGSFFGIEGLLPVLWMEPIRDLPRFMAVAVGFGAVLVTAGLVLNIVNAWRARERVNAILGARGLFGAFLYWVTLALAARALVPGRVTVPTTVLMAMVAVPVLLLVLRRPIVRLLQNDVPKRRRDPDSPVWLLALEGSVELVDAIFSYFANTISFVRVAAFAAVHAGVFVAMFAVSDTLARFGLGQPVSIVTLVAGNIVMIFLEGLTVSVQVLRLEYYEFFGKFFRGGGELYRPLMLQPRAEKGSMR